MRAVAVVLLMLTPLAWGQAARSSDGQWSLASDQATASLVLSDAAGAERRRYRVTSLDTRQTSRVAIIQDAAARRSFVIGLRDMAELWEISYDPSAPPIFDGYVHDYKMGEGIATPGFLGVRRTPLDDMLEGWVFDDSFVHAIGHTAIQAGRQATAQVINLDIRRRIAVLPLPDLPAPGLCGTYAWRGVTGRYCAP